MVLYLLLGRTSRVAWFRGSLDLGLVPVLNLYALALRDVLLGRCHQRLI